MNPTIYHLNWRVVATVNQQAWEGRTAWLSLHEAVITLPHPTKIGDTMDLVLKGPPDEAGTSMNVTCKAKTVQCVLRGLEGFRTQVVLESFPVSAQKTWYERSLAQNVGHAVGGT